MEGRQSTRSQKMVVARRITVFIMHADVFHFDVHVKYYPTSLNTISTFITTWESAYRPNKNCGDVFQKHRTPALSSPLEL